MWAAVLFGIALAIKTQAVLLAPGLFFLVCRGHLDWRAMPIIPSISILAAIPMIAFGDKPIAYLWMQFIGQVDLAIAEYNGKDWSLSPSIHHWVDLTSHYWLVLAALCILTLLGGYVLRRGQSDDHINALWVFIFGALMYQVMLPVMMDRYLILPLILTCVQIFGGGAELPQARRCIF